jgi:hypothetical protein
MHMHVVACHMSEHVQCQHLHCQHSGTTIAAGAAHPHSTDSEQAMKQAFNQRAGLPAQYCHTLVAPTCTTMHAQSQQRPCRYVKRVGMLSPAMENTTSCSSRDA